MRLVTFSDARGTRIGVHDIESATIVDLAASTRLPKDMTAFIALGRNGLKRARGAEERRGTHLMRRYQAAGAHSAARKKHPVRRQELLRSCARISQ